MKEKIMKVVIKGTRNQTLAVDWVAENSVDEYENKMVNLYSNRKIHFEIINTNHERVENSNTHVVGWAEGGMRYIYLK